MKKRYFSSLLPRCLVLIATVLLSACSYFDAPEPIEVSNQGEVIDLMDDTPSVPPPSVEDVIYENTDGGVEIYNLDRPIARGERIVPSEAARQQPASSRSGANIGSNSSVEIYPLDDDMARLIEPRAERYPPAAPPASVEPVQISSSTEAVVDDDGLVEVYFDHGSAKLDVGDLSIIEKVVARYDPTLGFGLDVTGHASVAADIKDPIQRKIMNLKISMNRAFAVAQALIQRGVPAEAIRVSGWGEVRPPRRNNGLSEEEAARRVEISSQSLQ